MYKFIVPLGIATCISIMGLIIAAPSYCQEDEASKTKTIDGNVVSADWEESLITVKWLRESGEIDYEETTLYVPERLKISEGGDAIGLMDVKVGAHVIVEYYENDETPTAKSITVIE
ncbi:MAG: hypothetical protein Q8N91_05930 [Candidatus Omnitrophota bacterium]|nr:hypothetical protein [Candidatus Omnitrophota bacterium]